MEKMAKRGALWPSFFSVVLLLAKSGIGADSGFLTFWSEIAICGHYLLNGGMLQFWGF